MKDMKGYNDWMMENWRNSLTGELDPRSLVTPQGGRRILLLYVDYIIFNKILSKIPEPHPPPYPPNKGWARAGTRARPGPGPAGPWPGRPPPFLYYLY